MNASNVINDTPVDRDHKSPLLKRMEDRKSQLTLRRRITQAMHLVSVATAIICIVIWSTFLLRYGISVLHSQILTYLLIYSICFVVIVPYFRGTLQRIDHDIQEIDFETDLLQFEVNPRETRAEKVLRINNLQLQRYYDLNLRQNIWIFGLGIFCIVLGLCVIGTTLYLVINEAADLDAKIITGVVGSIGSLLSSYIAAIYLKMHAAATSHLGDFHKRLVETQQLLLGNVLASRIEDDTQRWQTLSRIANGQLCMP